MSMTVKDVYELQRMALSLGAEVELDGRRFNTGQGHVQAAPKPKPELAKVPPPHEPVAPDPAPKADAITRAELEEALAQRDQQWGRQLGAITEAFKMALVSVSQSRTDQRRPSKWVFTTEYDNHDRLTKTSAKPVYDEKD